MLTAEHRGEGDSQTQAKAVQAQSKGNGHQNGATIAHQAWCV